MVEVVLATENMTSVICKIAGTGLEFFPYLPCSAFRAAIRQGRILAAIEDNKVLGYHWFIPKENDYWFGNQLCVVPQARGKGVGRALWNALIEEADSVNAGLRLKVAQANRIGISLYQSLDFHIVEAVGGKVPVYVMERDPRVKTSD